MRERGVERERERVVGWQTDIKTGWDVSKRTGYSGYFFNTCMRNKVKYHYGCKDTVSTAKYGQQQFVSNPVHINMVLQFQEYFVLLPKNNAVKSLLLSTKAH